MNIIGADIGRNTSLGVISVDEDLHITNVHTYFLNMHDVNGDDIDKKNVLYNMVNDITINREPFAFAIEAPFMSRFPKAYGLLSEFMAIIESAIFRIDSNIIQYRVSPKEAKKIIGAVSDDKDDMYNAIIKIPELEPYITEDMNEHEIDSIAIAYWVLERFRKDTGLFITDKYCKT